MDKQKEVFTKQWLEQFPNAPVPALDFHDAEAVERELTKCKELVKGLENQLKQTQFHLIFLQTTLAASKKSYERKKWGYGSSIDSEPDSPSPGLSNSDDNERPAAEAAVDNLGNAEEQQPNHHEVQMRTKPTATAALAQEHKSNRVSKVLENVKMFENISDKPPEPMDGKPPVPLQGNKSLPTRSSSRKRAPYLEVWECKTGMDNSRSMGSLDSNPSPAGTNDFSDTDSFAAAAVVMMDSSNKNRAKRQMSRSASVQEDQAKPSAAPSRENYVEVWTCSSGDQQDYGLEDIDAKDGFGKEHYTLAGSEVKLRDGKGFGNDPAANRLTWPASKANAPEQFQNENIGMGESLPHLTVSGVLSEGTCELSDLGSSSNNSSLSGSPTFERAASDGSGDQLLQDNKARTFPEASARSPFHQLSLARTTNERINALGDNDSLYDEYEDEYGDWVGGTPDERSLDSTEYSDEEEGDDDQDHADGESGLSSALIAVMNKKRSSRTGAAQLQHEDSISVDSLDKEIGEQKESSADLSKDYPTDHDGTDISPTHARLSSADNVSGMVDYHKVRSIAEAEKIRMRKWVVSSLLDSEETYLEYLNTLLLYMKPLKATISTSMPVMSNQDFDTLFYRVPELHRLHATFYEGLTPRLKDWNADTQIGDLFQSLLSHLNFYEDYVNNYKKAQHTAEKCAKENKQFADIIESLKVQSRKKEDSESISLIEILYKPAERVMRNTLVLQDLLKHTPHRHPDYHTLRQALKQAQQFLNRINASSSSSRGRKAPSSASLAAARTAQRELVKDGYLVEISPEAGNQRKLRHVFLYSDLLLCAKQKTAAGMFHNKESYECKWYIPLADLSFKPTEDSEGPVDVPGTSEEELRELSNRAIQLKKDIAREKKRLAGRKGQQSHAGHDGGAQLSSRQLERSRKKLAEVEAQIVLSAPNLPLRIFHMQGRCYLFLMSSDYERAEWSEAIIKQQESCFKSFSLTSLEVQSLLASCVRLRKVNTAGSMLIKDDEDLLSGYLTVTVHSGEGFLHACNPYCTLEVDSYGHFQTKAKTRICQSTDKPEWEMEFELEVDGAQTLRILCYDRARGMKASYDDDVLIAKGKVGLVQGSLRSHEWVKESVLMNEIEIKISVKFTPREQSLRRLPSHKSNGVFGVKIGTVTKREHSNVPSIVRMCVQEVENRGMDEVGIYRVSGVASEVQELKAYFDTNRKDVSHLLSSVDINAVAGVLKLYFRELPEPLFTNAKYRDFVEAVGLADPETKHNTMWRLLADLPPANYHTLFYMRKHLLRVSENESVNKMTHHNLATVFGPTLLRPAEDPSKLNTKGSDVMMLSELRMDVHYQMGVLLYCLELPKMPELGATTTGSKLVANAKDQDDHGPSQSPATVPKSVSGASITRGGRAPDNVYVQQNSDDSRHMPRQSSFGGASQKSRNSVSRSVTMDEGLHGDGNRPPKPEKPPKRGIGPPTTPASQLRERYHAYEVVDIVPLSRSPTGSSPSQSLTPNNAQNASNNNNSATPNKRLSHFGAKMGIPVKPPKVPSKASISKPIPAPRKPSVKKGPTTVVTDL